MEIDEFLCDFCQDLKPCDELAQKTIDNRLKCDGCMSKAIDKHEAEVDLSRD